MNYAKIETLLSQKGVSKMKFYEAVGLTHTGFSKMIKNETITVDTLEKIAAYFNIPVFTFFEENATKVPTVSDLQAKVSELYEENRDLLKENKALVEKIAVLEKSSVLPGHVEFGKLKEKR